MGVGMINTVLFMAVIFCGVWNIVPHRLQQLEMKSRACTNFTGCVCICFLFFFLFSVCIYLVTWTVLAEEERLSTTIVHSVQTNVRCFRLDLTSLCLGWSPELIQRVVQKSCATPPLWKHLCEQRSLSPLSSIFLLSASLSLSILPSGYNVASAARFYLIAVAR